MLQRQFAFILYICINLAALFCVCTSTHEFSGTWVQTLPAYAIASVGNLINSTICGKELQNFRDAVDQRIPWSLKVLDSSGRFKSGFLYGNTYWLGSRSQCLDTMNTAPLHISQRKISNSTLHRDLQKEFPPFEINYFVAHFRHNSTPKYYVNVFNEDVITLGFCLPASCTINNLIFILEKIFHDKVILIDDLYSVDFQLIQVKDLKDDIKWQSNGALLFVWFKELIKGYFVCSIALAFSVFMITIGTLYDKFEHQKYVKKNATSKINNNVKYVSKNKKMEINLSSRGESRIGRILMCFSVYINTRIIFSTELDADAIPSIHGLKFLSMCFIIFSHTIFFELDFLDNKIWLWRYINSWNNINVGIFITIGAILIDIFFFSSGCLATYSYFRNKTNKGQIEQTGREKLNYVFVQIAKKFVRLTPAYMMTLGILQLSSIWLDKTSQFYTYKRWHETCAKYWWSNLLYINNFFDLDAMCMIWSWYVATDMQFYIIAIILLTLSTTYFYTTVTILGTFLIGSVIYSGYTSYIYGIDRNSTQYLTLDEHWRELANYFHFPPWIRVNPYIIGIITGYILIKAKNYFILKKKIIILFCYLTVACNILILFYSLHEQYISILSIAVYIAVYRLLWIIPIALVVIKCSIKHGDIVNQFLSFKAWLPFSRLTYCVYLLHPIIIRSVCLCNETSISYQYLPTFIMSLGYIVISYLCSYVLSLMVEMPYISLMQLFIQYCNTKKCNMLDKKLS